MAKYYDIDDVITDEEIVAVIFQKAASGLGIDPSSETDCNLMFFVINCRQTYCCEATLGGIHYVLSRSSIKFFQSHFFSELVRTNELCQRCSDACVKLGREMGVKVVDLFTALQKRDDWVDA
uniref:Uncharacterized protein n=1 Tax=Quercus lobata TaxID=97700 RepID=A0A7N2L468_QUELO